MEDPVSNANENGTGLLSRSKTDAAPKKRRILGRKTSRMLLNRDRDRDSSPTSREDQHHTPLPLPIPDPDNADSTSLHLPSLPNRKSTSSSSSSKSSKATRYSQHQQQQQQQQHHFLPTPPMPIGGPRRPGAGGDTTPPVMIEDIPSYSSVSNGSTGNAAAGPSSYFQHSSSGTTGRRGSSHSQSYTPSTRSFLHPSSNRPISSYSQNSIDRLDTSSLNGVSSHSPGPASASIPSRFGGWLTNLLPGSNNSSAALPSTNANSLPSPSAPPSATRSSTTFQSPQQSPQRGSRGLLAAARERGAIMRYLTDSDARNGSSPSEGEIWLLGVKHSRDTSLPHPPPPPHTPSVNGTNKKGLTNLFSSSSLSLGLPSPGSSQNGGITAASEEGESTHGDSPRRSSGKRSTEIKSSSRGAAGEDESRWPGDFYLDFQSSIWCTYRSAYDPINNLPLQVLLPPASSYDTTDFYPLATSIPSFISTQSPQPQQQQSLPQSGLSSTSAIPSGRWQAWTEVGRKLAQGGLGGIGLGEKELTSDTGWGCMLRTGQSLLANSLIHLYLGRDWRRPSSPPSLATSTPSELEAYARYVRILTYFLDDPSPYAPFSVHRMASIGKLLGKEIGEWFGPSTAAGAIKSLANAFPGSGLGVSVATDGVVFKSDVYESSWVHVEGSDGDREGKWGGKPVLILIGIRLGLGGVNPIYYDSVKSLFTFPQSVGIAGGRPSSSYYFLGHQSDSLIYLDPHHTRPTIPLVVPPQREQLEQQREMRLKSATQIQDARRDDIGETDFGARSEASDAETVTKHNQEPMKTALAESISPQFSSPPPHPPSISSRPSTPQLPSDHPQLSHSSASSVPSTPLTAAQFSELDIDPLTEWYITAYSDAQLKTFHCDRVRKVPLSGLDPSMLLGFLCKTEDEFLDFCARVNEMSKRPGSMFSVANEPSSWEDDASGIQSFSDHSNHELDGDDDALLEDDSLLLDESSDATHQNELMTTEIPISPILNRQQPRPAAMRVRKTSEQFELVEDDDWVGADGKGLTTEPSSLPSFSEEPVEIDRPPLALVSDGASREQLPSKASESASSTSTAATVTPTARKFKPLEFSGLMPPSKAKAGRGEVLDDGDDGDDF